MTYTIEKPRNFSLSQTFDCGQCFRFNKISGRQDEYEGVSFGKYLHICEDDEKLYFHNCSKDDFDKIWRSFFDMDTDYSSIISSFSDDAVLSDAAIFSSGIRILRQDPWETLCSFIISQNNNIPRIKGIIENLSKTFGTKIEGTEKYAFPTANALANAGEEKIFSLKTGFRAKYIYDAAQKVSSGEICLDDIFMYDTQKALDVLMTIKGVGPKVASCVLLFAYHKYDAFPVDVWVKRILEKYYADGKSAHLSGQYAGIAQQYLFYYERCRNNVYLK